MVSKYLVTGASGYIAMHVVDQLLKQGYHVRGTIRSLNDKEKVESLKKLGPVELVEAELCDAESWKRAVKGIDVVLHVASPLPVNQVADENLIIKPAVEGTMNVLKASLEEQVKRVVFTSSGLTIYNYEPSSIVLNEDYWVPIEKAKTAYQKSKILAEKAAWDFYNQHKHDAKCFKFVSVIPVWVLGPPLSAASGASVTRFSRLLDPSVERVDNFYSGVCDVRDVARAHVRAAELDEAVGQRVMVNSSDRLVSLADLVDILRADGYKATLVERKAEDEAKYADTRFDNSRIRAVLKMETTELKRTVLDMTEALINYGIVKNSK